MNKVPHKKHNLPNFIFHVEKSTTDVDLTVCRHSTVLSLFHPPPFTPLIPPPPKIHFAMAGALDFSLPTRRRRTAPVVVCHAKVAWVCHTFPEIGFKGLGWGQLSAVLCWAQ